MKSGSKNDRPACKLGEWAWRVYAHLQRIEAGECPDEGVPLADPELRKGAGQLVAAGLARVVKGKVKLVVPIARTPRAPVRQLPRTKDPAFAFGRGPEPSPDDAM